MGVITFRIGTCCQCSPDELAESGDECVPGLQDFLPFLDVTILPWMACGCVLSQRWKLSLGWTCQLLGMGVTRPDFQSWDEMDEDEKQNKDGK